MARMRKIPARKHHGVRDPLKQLETKAKKLKHVTNNPPEKGNDQKVSFRFAQFKKIADQAKAGKKLKRIHSGHEDKPKAATTTKKDKNNETGNKFRNIKQFVDEEDGEYMRRVKRITGESLREAKYEAKYGVNVVRDAKTGSITIKKRPLNEIDELLKQKRKVSMKGAQGKELKPMDPKMAKALIKQAIKEDDEEKKKDNTPKIEEYKRDSFQFGEVVHAPPTLSTLPRKAKKNDTVPRPGMKNNLLLKTLLNPNAPENAATTTTTALSKKSKTKSTTVTKAQLKGKRKDLPAATRSMLETEQSKIIELYRNLKKSQEKSIKQ